VLLLFRCFGFHDFRGKSGTGKEFERVYGTFMQRLTLFLFPGVMLAALYVSLPFLGMLPTSWRDFLPYAVYLTFSLGLFLSFHFNRSRVFFVLLLLLAFCWNSDMLARDGEAAAAILRLDSIFCFLLPINITLFCLMREKGIFTVAGRKRFVFLVLQAFALVILAKTAQADSSAATAAWLQKAAAGCRDLTRLTLPLMGGCGLVIAVTTYVRHSIIDSAFLGVLAALAIVFTHPPTGDIPAVFLIGSGLILLVSILQDSHNMAYRDDLTGVLSRRAFNEHLNGLGRRYVIAMLDLDHFKQVNDSYGHDVGDQVLRLAGAKLRSVGNGARVYRYGGEEFAIVFPGKNKDHVLACMEKLRDSIASYRFVIRGPERPEPYRDGRKNRYGGGTDSTISVTVSIGVAEIVDGKVSPREIIVAADVELYRAKQRGRNRICSAGV
jgi:GGDEF domain-containing protein